MHYPLRFLPTLKLLSILGGPQGLRWGDRLDNQLFSCDRWCHQILTWGLGWKQGVRGRSIDLCTLPLNCSKPPGLFCNYLGGSVSSSVRDSVDGISGSQMLYHTGSLSVRDIQPRPSLLVIQIGGEGRVHCPDHFHLYAGCLPALASQMPATISFLVLLSCHSSTPSSYHA